MFRLQKIRELYNLYYPKARELATRRPAVTYAVGVVVLLVLVWLLALPKSATNSDIVVAPTRGEFLVTVITSGELQAKNSINNMGPEEARAAYIWQMKLTNIIAEGTVVRKGISSRTSTSRKSPGNSRIRSCQSRSSTLSTCRHGSTARWPSRRPVTTW